MSTRLQRPYTHIPPKGAPRRSARQSILAAWRGRDLQPLEEQQRSHAQPIANVLPKVLKTIRYEQRQDESQLLKIWNDIIDPVITSHAQPVGINKGTLFIKVDSNVWLSEIVRYRQREVLQRLQHACGATLIQRLSWRIG